MSMEISNNYSNYAANYVDTVKKPDSKAAAEVKTNTSTNSKDKIQAYYEQLCKKFPQINFNTNGGILPSNSRDVLPLPYTSSVFYQYCYFRFPYWLSSCHHRMTAWHKEILFTSYSAGRKSHAPCRELSGRRGRA